MLHLIFVALRAAILRFEIPRCRIIAEITVEILGVTVPQMGLSGLLAIWVGSVGDINELPVDKVSKKVLIGLPPLLCLVVALAMGGIWQKWREGSGVVLVL